jgi:hypothetical protein
MNYTEIRDLALSYSDREDSDLISRIDGFLYMVEAKLNRLLMSNEMEVSTIIPYTSDSIYEYALPTDFGEVRTISFITDGDINSKNPLEMINPDQMAWAKLNSSSNYYYSINTGKLEVYPSLSSNQSILLKYLQNVPKLSSTNITNWLSIKYPDVYIVGLLIEINTFAKDWDAVANFNSRFDMIVNDTILKDKRAKHSGNPMRVRVG